MAGGASLPAAGQAIATAALGIAGILSTALLLVFLRLHANIRTVLDNYAEGATGIKADWFSRAERAAEAGLAAIVSLWAMRALAGTGAAGRLLGIAAAALSCLAATLSGTAVALLVYENFTMYWRLTARRVAGFWPFRPAFALAAAATAAVVLGFPPGTPAAAATLVVLDGALAFALLAGIALASVVRRPGWDAPPARSAVYFEARAAGVYRFGERRDEPLGPPAMSVRLDPAYGGEWVVAGDLDGDGAVEIVSARNRLRHDNHHTAAVAAQRLDGSPLWRWGDPAGSRASRSYDLACQIHDWNGDGRPEVVVAADGWLVELEGRTGRELRRFPIPRRASDMLMFADLRGLGRPSDVIVKDRYHRLLAYDGEGRPLFEARDPGGFMLAHRPLALDIDGDGRDEILAGFALLGPDGAVRWSYRSDRVALWFGGHQDSACVYRLDPGRPENTRIVFTFCDAMGMAMVDGNGRRVWELGGRHFATVAVARLLPGQAEPQIVVDLGHLPRNAPGEVWVLDGDGKHLATLRGPDRAFPIDWDGDGVDELVFAPQAPVGESAEPLSLFAMAPDFYRFRGGSLFGTGAMDVMMAGNGMLDLYRNPGGKPAGASGEPGARPRLLGTPPNASSYSAPLP